VTGADGVQLAPLLQLLLAVPAQVSIVMTMLSLRSGRFWTGGLWPARLITFRV
ncbi:MAG: hypothetical protein QOD93_2851, partial [Acetobacteraceae bacterium]|nr:hypothetical protein [Acetobacteraceae bacterium]